MGRFSGRRRRFLGRTNSGPRAGTTKMEFPGVGAALYFDTPPGYIGHERPIRVSILDGTQTGFTVDEARQWLADCKLWLDENYPITDPCECCNGAGIVVVTEVE